MNYIQSNQCTQRYLTPITTQDYISLDITLYINTQTLDNHDILSGAKLGAVVWCGVMVGCTANSPSHALII